MSVNKFKDTIIYGNFQNSDNYKVGGNIANATFDRSITVGLTGYLKNGLGITGNIGLTGNIYQYGNLGITGNIGLTGNIYQYGNLGITGNIGLTGNINQYGNLGITGNIGLTGNINQYGNLGITGDINLSGSLKGGTIVLPSYTGYLKYQSGLSTPNVIIPNNGVNDVTLVSTGNTQTLTNKTLTAPNLTTVLVTSGGIGVTGSSLFNNDITVSGVSYLNNNVNVLNNLGVTGSISVGSTGYFNSSIKLPNNQIIDTSSPLLVDLSSAQSLSNKILSNCTVSGYLTGSSSISDSQLSSNVCLLNSTPSFVSNAKFYNGYSVYGGNIGTFLDSTNSNSTQISQYNTDCYIINYTSGGTIFINSSIVNLQASYTYLKGGTNTNNYNTHFPYTDGKNYISGTTNLRFGNVNITDGLLTCSNGLTVSGSVTLPNTSISDSALSSNVVLLNSSNTLTNKTLNNCDASTQLSSDNSTKIATTAFVKSLGYISSIPSTYALLASPVFTGTPTAPTAVSSTNTTQIATTAFVKSLNYVTSASLSGYLTSSSSITDSQLSSNIPLKNANNIYTGSATYNSGTTINLYNSTNTSYTQLSQSGVYYIMSNATNAGYITLRTLDGTGTANDLNINATDIICNKNLYIYNSKVLVFKDTNNVTQSNLSQVNGSLYFDNYSTNGENYMIFRTCDTQATPVFNVRMSIRYDAVAIQNGTVLRIFNASNTNYLQAEQYLFNSYISNFANSNVASNSGTQAIILRTCNTAGSLIENMIVQYNKITCNQALQVNNGFTLTGSLSLPSGSIADSYLSSNVPLKNGTNSFSGSNTFTTTTTCSNGFTLSGGTLSLPAGSVADSFLSSNIVKLNGSNSFTGSNSFDDPIYLPTKYTTNPITSSSQLGYIYTATYLNNTSAFNFTTGTAYNLAYITLPSGVWNIIASTACRQTNNLYQPQVYYEISIGATSQTLDGNCYITGFDQMFYNSNFIKQITRNVYQSSFTPITFYLVMKLTYTQGTVASNNASYPYINITATRIG